MPDVIDQSKWGGVCGFVSAIHGLRARGDITSLGKTMSTGDLEDSLGAEMITYLKMTQVERPAIANAIVTFTRTWGKEYTNITLNEIIEGIKTAVKSKYTTGDWASKPGLGCALPTEAAEDYLDFIGLKHKRVLNGQRMPFTKQVMGKYKDCLVGTGASGKSGNGWNGLRHWVYVTKTGTLYNWAKDTPMDDSVDIPYDGGDPKHDMIVYAIQLL